MEIENEIINDNDAPEEAKPLSLFEAILDLEEVEEVEVLNTDILEDLLKDLDKCTTIKRLSLVDDLESRLKKSFLLVEKARGKYNTFYSIRRLLQKSHSDIDFDYYLKRGVIPYQELVE